jgi:CRP-like cAMP-binding protein
MLTNIEKIIFLKQVPFFEEMPTRYLRVLADITEEVSFDTAQRIIAEGERTNSLYVIVGGKVAIQRRKKDVSDQTLAQLAVLGPKEYFGEMSLFDHEPHSADVIALKPTQLLVMRYGPLAALIKRHPEMALGLFKVLSQRLRQANVMLSKKQR